jgi:hypothetical protein
MAMTIPIDNRMEMPNLARRAAAWLRLFAIELRRTPALYAGLLIAAVTAWGMWTRMPAGVVRWDEVSHSAGQAMITTSAIAAGIGAYVARRDERLHLDDQLAQTAFGQARRDVLSLLATLTWCLVAYIVPVGGFFAYASATATWARPEWGYPAITAATIVLGVAGGWFTGTFFPNRFSVLVAVGASMAVHGFYPLSYRLRTVEETGPDGFTYFTTSDSWYKNLLPHEVLDYYDMPAIIGWGMAWLVGIGALFLCVAWWWRHRSIAAIVGLSLAALVAGPASAALVGEEPVDWLERSRSSYVDPTCEPRLDGQIEICVHPKNETLLDDAAAVIEPLVAPVAGIPGVPTRFEEQQPVELVPGVVWFYIHDGTSVEMFVTSSVIRELLNDPTSDMQHVTGSAQYVVLAWLLEEIGISQEEAFAAGHLPPVRYAWQVDEVIAEGIMNPNVFAEFMYAESETALPDGFEDGIRTAIDRMAALPDDERRAWLEANWDALVANELALEDLP